MSRFPSSLSRLDSLQFPSQSEGQEKEAESHRDDSFSIAEDAFGILSGSPHSVDVHSENLISSFFSQDEVRRAHHGEEEKEKEKIGRRQDSLLPPLRTSSSSAAATTAVIEMKRQIRCEGNGELPNAISTAQSADVDVPPETWRGDHLPPRASRRISHIPGPADTELDAFHTPVMSDLPSQEVTAPMAPHRLSSGRDTGWMKNAIDRVIRKHAEASDAVLDAMGFKDLCLNGSLGKVKYMCCIMDSIEWDAFDTDAYCTLRYPGVDANLSGTIAMEAVNRWEKRMKEGCVFLLRDVTIYSSRPRLHHAILALRNIVDVYNAEDIPINFH
eukprot:TRINITY_DN63441_c0_g1_i1.p1 TRINITY_DN63441_c0_g1~~TRINITY_DN63441_c0_g1_i1.p1  ORF type:complete len:329 (+),score=92.83 TRINITY_DN63441_c0_g1_i1:99-1085(+)